MALNKANLAKRVKGSKSLAAKMIDCNNWIVEGTLTTYKVRFNTTHKPATATCVDRETGQYCKGNSVSVCRHAIAALLARADAADGDIKVAFCANADDGRRLARIGGTPHRIRNGLCNSELWFVSFADKTDSEVDAIQARILDARIAQLDDAIAHLETKAEQMPWSILVKKDLAKHIASRAEMIAGQ